ncbi:MAG TPA: DUF1254 domain-containing protein [Woeseiaceae bacterium]|nr:DUF1254 domain-containing protein [Woeseiaceae bacterium]
MIRWLGWLLAGIFLGGIVHLSTVLLLPELATRDAYARLLPLTETNRVALLPQPSPDGAALPFMDPAFATAICRYDLSGGPLKVRAQVTQAYTSVTFYTRRAIAFYAINDRSVGGRMIELDLMTSEQRSLVPEDEDVTAADRLIVESPTPTGLMVLRALAPEPGAMPIVRGILSTAQCTPSEQ